MSQAGYTPIKLYYSTTALAVPSSGNLADGELALNIADMKLYAKNSSGAVTLLASSASSGTVSTVSVVSANGLAGTVANPTTTPAITLSTSITGVLKGNGTAISAAVSGTDYAPATSGTAILKGNGAGGFSNATSGTDYAPATSGTSILYGNGSGGFSNVTIGTNLTFAGGTLSVSGGGAPPVTNYTNQSANITLTSSDANSIINITLANDITLTLPDATTLTSAKNFTIKNDDDTYGVMVFNAAGTYLFAIPPSQGVSFWATSTATSAGAWSSAQPTQDYLSQPFSSTAYPNEFSTTPWNRNITAISSTVAIISYYSTGGSAAYYVQAVQLSGGVMTYGTPVFVGTYNNYSSIFAIDGSTCFFAVGDLLGASVLGVVLSVSGTTITLGTVTTLLNSSAEKFGGNLSICALSSTDLIVAVYTQAGAVTLVPVTLSGTTITAGTSSGDFITGALSSYAMEVVALNSTQFLLFWNDASSYLKIRVVTYSGGSFTGGTIANNSVTQYYAGNVVALSATSFAITCVTSASNIIAIAGTISGTTITLGSSTNLYTGADSGTAAYSAGVSSTRCLMVFTVGAATGGMYAKQFDVSGTTVTPVAGTTTINNNNNTNGTFAYNWVTSMQTPAIATPSASDFMTSADLTTLVRNNAMSVSGSTITPATPNSPYLGAINPVSTMAPEMIEAFNDTQFIHITNQFYTNGAGYKLTASLYSVNNTTITLEDSELIATNYSTSTNSYSVATLSSTLAVVFYADASGYATACAITRSGTTLTVGTPVTILATASTILPCITMLSSTTAAVGFRNGSTAQQAKMAVLSISGTTITSSAVVSFSPESNNLSGLKVEGLSASNFALGAAYTSSGFTYIKIFNISVVGGAPVAPIDNNVCTQIGDGVNGSFQIRAISSTQALIVFQVTYSSQSYGSNSRYGFGVNLITFGLSNTAYVSGYSTQFLVDTSYQNNLSQFAVVVPTSATTGYILGSQYYNAWAKYSINNGILTTSLVDTSTYQPSNAYPMLTLSTSGPSCAPLVAPVMGGRYSTKNVIWNIETTAYVAGAVPQYSLQRFRIHNAKGAIA